MQTVNGIDAPTINFALELLRKQTFVPKSPAAYDEQGKLCLCAAGILARAGLNEVLTPYDAELFWGDIAVTADKSRLFQAFHLLGWSSELCQDIISENDRSDPALRRPVVEQKIASLGNASTDSNLG